MLLIHHLTSGNRKILWHLSGKKLRKLFLQLLHLGLQLTHIPLGVFINYSLEVFNDDKLELTLDKNWTQFRGWLYSGTISSKSRTDRSDTLLLIFETLYFQSPLKETIPSLTCSSMLCLKMALQPDVRQSLQIKIHNFFKKDILHFTEYA